MPGLPLRDPVLVKYFGGSSTVSGVPVTEWTALNFSSWWGAVQIISNAVAALPLFLYRRLPNGGKERFTTHPLYRILHDEFNAQMTSVKARQTMQAHVLTWGNAYAEIVFNGANQVAELRPITPDRVTPDLNSQNDVIYRVIQPSGREIILAAERVLHIQGLGFDGLVGYSVVRRAREAIGLGLTAEAYGAQFFGNGAVSSLVATHPKTLNDSARQNLKASITEAVGGAKKHSVLVLEEGMTVEKTSIPPDDAQFLLTRRFQAIEICKWFNLPPHKLAELDRATFCLPGEALVFTETGPRPIAQVLVGERVWSRTEDHRWVLRAITASACTGQDEILEIRAGLRTLRCNARHRIPVRRQALEPWTGGRGRSIKLDGVRYRKTWDTVIVPAGDIRPGDELVALGGLGAEGGTVAPTRAHCSSAFMEALGLIVGDGFFARNYRSQVGSVVGISHGEHDSHMAHYIAAIEAEFTAGDGPYAMRRGGRMPLVHQRRDKNTTVFHSTPMHAELVACGIAGTAKTKRVPAWIFGLNDELKLAFLRGYLDADGTVNTSGQIRYVSVNRALLDDMRHLCMSVGVRCGNQFSTEIASQFGARAYQHTLWAFICTDARDNARIGSHTKFYQRRLGARVESRPMRAVPIYPHEVKRRRREPGVTFTRVRSVTREGERQPVYNLTVDETHNFIADGTLVRNSNIEHQSIEFVTDCLRPWLVTWEQELNRKVIKPLESKIQFTEHLVDGLLRGDTPSRYAAYQLGIQSGFLCADDVRERENMNPLPNGTGQVFLVPLNMVPADRLDEVIDAQVRPPTPPAAPAREPAPEPDPERVAKIVEDLRQDVAGRLVKVEETLVGSMTEWTMELAGHRDEILTTINHLPPPPDPAPLLEAVAAAEVRLRADVDAVKLETAAVKLDLGTVRTEFATQLELLPKADPDLAAALAAHVDDVEARLQESAQTRAAETHEALRATGDAIQAALATTQQLRHWQENTIAMIAGTLARREMAFAKKLAKDPARAPERLHAHYQRLVEDGAKDLAQFNVPASVRARLVRWAEEASAECLSAIVDETIADLPVRWMERHGALTRALVVAALGPAETDYVTSPPIDDVRDEEEPPLPPVEPVRVEKELVRDAAGRPQTMRQITTQGDAVTIIEKEVIERDAAGRPQKIRETHRSQNGSA